MGAMMIRSGINIKVALLCSVAGPVMTLSAAPSIAQAQTAPSPQAEGRVTGRVVTPSGAFLTGAEVRVEGSDNIAG